jgi:regulator of replication initiation timing
MKFELHPLCALFPRMAGAEFEALKADIQANGLRHPIVTHKGMILDGGNRYQACMDLGVKPLMTEYSGENLVTYVLSANFFRRHLSPGQQAAIVASAQDWATAKGVGNPQFGNVTGLATVADRAAASGASDKTQRMADSVARKSPELAAKVAHGEISLPKAAKQVANPKPAKKPKKNQPQIQLVDPAVAEKLDEAQEAVSVLSEENDRLNDRLAIESMEASDEEKRAATETIAELRAKVKTLEAELSAVKASRDGYMQENAQLKKQVAMQRKQLDKVAA